MAIYQKCLYCGEVEDVSSCVPHETVRCFGCGRKFKIASTEKFPEPDSFLAILKDVFCWA